MIKLFFECSRLAFWCLGTRRLLIFFTIIFFASLFEVVSIYSLWPFFYSLSGSDVSLYESTPIPYLDAKSYAVLGLMIFSVSVLIRFLLDSFLVWWSKRLGSEISQKAFNSMISKNILAFLGTKSSDWSVKILNESINIADGVVFSWLKILSLAIMIIAIGISLFYVYPGTVILILISLVLFYTFILLLFQSALKLWGALRLQTNQRRFITVDEVLSGFKSIAFYGVKQRFCDEFRSVSNEFADAQSKAVIVSSIPRPLLEFFASLVLAVGVVMTLGSTDTHLGIEILPDLSVLALVAYKLLPAFQQLFRSVSILSNNSPLVRKWLFEIELSASSEGLQTDSNVSDSVGFFGRQSDSGLEKKDLEFGLVDGSIYDPDYNLGAVELIRIAKLTFQVGEVAWVHGDSGTGKSLLMMALVGLDVGGIYSGKYMVNGLQCDRVYYWRLMRDQMAYIPQEPVIMRGTVFDNLHFGSASRGDEESGLDCLRAVSLVSELGGEKRCLTKEIDVGGSPLSGGQKQRLCIARGIFQGASIFVIDEGTSGISEAAEVKIIELLKSRGVTIIMVSHRSKSSETADRKIHIQNKGMLEG